MKKLNVIIEHADENLSAYIEGVPVIVVGDNLAEIQCNMREAIELYLEEVKVPVKALSGEYELVFHFDPQTLLTYYSRIFSFVALQYLTGINQKQLCHYASGLSKPREAQCRKIETALRNLGSELSAISL